MLPQDMLDEARLVIETWLPQYPRAVPWIDDHARAEFRRSEDAWLDTFNGLLSLTQPQVHDLINWKWQGYWPRRSQSRKGVDADWSHARRCIETALAKPNSGAAIDALRGGTGGIPNWQTAMASVVLAACKPQSYTVADSRALRTMMLIKHHSDSAINKVGYFPRGCWEGYHAFCLELAQCLGIQLRDIDRAFWVCAGKRG